LTKEEKTRVWLANQPLHLTAIRCAPQQQVSFVVPPKSGRLMCCLAFEDESLGRLYAEEEKVEED
jgi:cell fate regulator YaaT (PSP1 superfamily)